MRLSPTLGLAAFAATANAFADSSPFSLFSTAEFEVPADVAQLQSKDKVLQSVHNILDSCPTERYYIVSQPNAHAADIRGPEGCKARSLCDAITSEHVKSSYSVAEVVGEISPELLAEYIQVACDKKSKSVIIETTALPAISSNGDHASQFAENDALLSKTIQQAQAPGTYTFVYLTSPGEMVTYEAEFGNSMSDELKKLRARVVPTRRDDNQTDWNKLPLFEKYQFFTPGIFHAIVFSLILFAILGVGLNALGSLEVSYAAFDKEMGPAAQKKQN